MSFRILGSFVNAPISYAISKLNFFLFSLFWSSPIATLSTWMLSTQRKEDPDNSFPGSSLFTKQRLPFTIPH